ncbi:MAG: tRNA1(Val) (adenine(37)-N6)-methyltransferase [Lachnospiraceae bacterium]|nr:tRNA1(Val) (adenine(37)-N6)-methyltransferase [Lachnospiraceae bacterium]
MTPEQRAEALLPGERLDDLQRGGLYIIQDPALFCFGMDAVLLSDFAACREGNRVLDLCSGNGIIPLLLYARCHEIRVTGLELNEKSAFLAERSIRLNGLEDRISMITGDVREASRLFGHASFHVVTANPPYMKAAGGLKNMDSAKAMARHETACSFDDVCAAAAHCLKSSGRFYLVHRPSRLPELITVLKEHHLEPKRMQLVYPYADKDANLVLIEAVKGGGPEMKLLPPLIVYKEDGSYTDDIYRIYGAESKK